MGPRRIIRHERDTSANRQAAVIARIAAGFSCRIQGVGRLRCDTLRNYKDQFQGGSRLSEWAYAQEQPAERLCRIEQYAVMKQQAGGDVEFLITVREYFSPPDPAMRFLAQADKQTNQKTAPYTPTGWGSSLLQALAECLKAIRKFPYEP
jgi:hypothetical protein